MYRIKGIAATVIVALVLAAATAWFLPAQAAEGDSGNEKMKEKMTEEQMEQAGDLLDMFNEKLKHRFAPVIESVSFGAAKVGSPVDVTVKAKYESKDAIDKIKSASVYYIKPGDDFLEGPVELEAAGNNTFKGQIPALKKAGKVMVVPRVKDSFGNVGVELACKVTMWPPFGDPCMAPGAADADPLDDPPAIIEDDFDIWGFQVGMDDEYIYLSASVQGEISKGTMSPPHINAYLSMLVDTQELYGLKDISVFMNPDARDKFKDKVDKAALVFYAPLGPMVDSKMKPCFIPRPPEGGGSGGSEGMDFSKMMDTKHVECEADGPDLFTKIDKSILSDSMDKTLSVVGSLNGFIENMQMPMPTMREMLPVTKVTYNPNSFNVN